MDQKEYQQLAQEFIDLWQQQLGTVVTNKQFVETMFANLQKMANYATPESHEHTTSSTTGDVAERLGELEFRLRMAEQRLERLESQPKTKTSARRTTKRRTSGSTKKLSTTTKRHR